MSKFIELERLEKVISKYGDLCRTRVLAEVTVGEKKFPIYGMAIGTEDKSAPTLGLFGGVHGLERVGTQLCLSFMETFYEILQWDTDARSRLDHMRIVLMPLVNPGGMFMGRRSNPNGVDLNRNAPVEAELKPLWLLGGHRMSSKLPWYRGPEGAPMEIESLALCNFVREELFSAKTSLVLDIHSGFGSQDQLWYPYAKTRGPFPRLKEVEALGNLLNRSYPNHVYKIEPQALNYTTHGDLWDYLFDEHMNRFGLGEHVFIPWTLELGSWLWVRKNPTQLFSSMGPFNPVKEHRLRRAMRRHVPLIDFFLRAVRNHASWMCG